MIFGTWEKNKEISKRVNTLHAQIPAAMKQQHLAWVGATLMYGSILGYETFFGKLSDEKKDEYVREGAKPLFEQLNLNTDSLPGSYQELEGYIFDQISSGKIRATEHGKKLIPSVFLSQTMLPDIKVRMTKGRVKGVGIRVPRPKIEVAGLGEVAMSLPKLITLGLMQEVPALDRLREDFGLQELTHEQMRVFRGLSAASRTITPRLPERLRQHPTARLAQKRDSYKTAT